MPLNATHAYLGIAPCGHARTATVDCPAMARDNATEIARWLRGGYTIERVLIDEARQRLHFCDCARPRRSQQPRLEGL